MAYGLFGKAPQKRDFLSLNMPNAVLHPFETWLQSAVAASRSELGREWDNHYLVAPIWRFWLGREVLGTACMGAVMSSLDQVGRYFPLAIIYYADPGEELVPPLMNTQPAWYEAIEQRLLAVLSRTYEVDIATLLDGLQRPAATPLPRPRTQPAAAPLAVLGQAGTDPAPDLPAGTVVRLSPAELSAPPPAASPLPAVDEEDKGATPEIEPDLPPPEDAPLEPASPGSLWESEPDRGDVRLSSNGNAASSSTQALKGTDTISATAASLWDDPVPPNEEGARTGQGATSLWDDAGTASASAAPLEVSTELLEERPAGVAEPAAQRHQPDDPAPLPADEENSPRMLAGTFKGGVSVLLEGEIDAPASRSMLLDQDHLNAAAGRSYWWCRLPSIGASRVYLKQGLPDPFFYSRMLLWEPQTRTDDRS